MSSSVTSSGSGHFFTQQSETGLRRIDGYDYGAQTRRAAAEYSSGDLRKLKPSRRTFFPRLFRPTSSRLAIDTDAAPTALVEQVQVKRDVAAVKAHRTLRAQTKQFRVPCFSRRFSHEQRRYRQDNFPGQVQPARKSCFLA